MSISILGGFAKGFVVKVPNGNIIRPTAVMLKRKLFDSHQNFEGKIFVDACSGSGAIGLEAHSRGAEKVYFIENSRNVYKTLNDNINKYISKFDVQNELSISCIKVEKWLISYRNKYNLLPEEKMSNSIIFLDPPYENTSIYQEVIEQVLVPDWFKGELWIESDQKKGLSLEYWESNWKSRITKVFRQGTKILIKLS